MCSTSEVSQIKPASDQNQIHFFFLSNCRPLTLHLELTGEITSLGHADLFDYEPGLATWVDKEYKLTSRSLLMIQTKTNKTEGGMKYHRIFTVSLTELVRCELTSAISFSEQNRTITVFKPV